MTDIATLFDEDLSRVDTRMPLLASCIEDFTVKAVELQQDDKGDRLRITLNSTKPLKANDGTEISSNAPHFGTLFLTGNDNDALKRDRAAWCQTCGVATLGENGRNLVGQTGKFNVTIKGEFNRFRPVSPNGK